MLCACGCGKETGLHRKGFRQFIAGHQHKNKTAHNAIPPEIQAKIIDYYLDGKSQPQCAEKFGIVHSTVSSILRKNGISARTISESRLGQPGLCGEDNPMFGRTGLKHPNYKNPEDRISLVRNQIRKTDEYKEWRLQIFGRDNFTCQYCRVRGTYLEPHHIKMFSELLEENNIQSKEDAIKCSVLWNLNNGITYCKGCHDLLKHKGGLL